MLISHLHSQHLHLHIYDPQLYQDPDLLVTLPFCWVFIEHLVNHL